MAEPPSLHAPGPDRFGRALLAAACIECLLIGGLALLPRPPAPVPPAVVSLHITMPPAPKPVVKPPPPKPPPPALIPPPVPVPVTPPPPPVPHHIATHHILRRVIQAPPPPTPPPAPAPPAPVTAAPPISSLAAQTALSRYIGQLRAIMDANLVIPQQLIDAGLAGDCVLEFTLSPDGSIQSAELITPSGLQSVNQAALAALRASTFPPFLPGMPSTPHSFTLPIHVGADEQD